MTTNILRSSRLIMAAAALLAAGLSTPALAAPVPGDESTPGQPVGTPGPVQPGYVRVETTDAAARPAPRDVQDECKVGGILCGVIYNPNYDGIPFGIIHSWGEGYSRILQKGQRSKVYWADTDGFYVGAGACARWGVYTPDPNGGFYWRDYFYNGPVNVKVFDYIYDHHVTAWNRRC
ncbi:hypothetical protein AB0P21_23215 [Kribbella sp. NPDC056861]|uniref:hypothetical protein n=1 Tax=Kribbella sp. NPDC056861 TaxID=3154857 RepID=UPI0034244737